MKKTKYIVLTITAAAVVLFIALLPTMLSSSSALKLLLPQINRYTPGTLSITSWKPRWNSGFQAAGITYSDPDQGVTLTFERITTQKGLLQLVLAPRQLGEIVFNKPVLLLAGRPNHVGPVDVDEDTNGEAAGPKSETVSPTPGAKPIWEGVTGRIKVYYGRVLLQQNQEEREVARDIVLEADFTEGRVNHSLHLLSGDRGRIEAEGFANIPVYVHNIFETLVSETQVSISALDAGGLLEFASLFGEFPKGSGGLSGLFTLRTSGVRDVHLTGKSSLNNLQLTGGWLGNDRPAYNKVHIEIDGGRDVRRGLYLSPLSLEADGISIMAKGQYGAVENLLQVNSTLDLSELSQRFPGLLKARGLDRLDSGELRFTADLAKKNETFQIDANAIAAGLKGMHKGRAFRWDTPVELTVQADKGADEIFINRFQVEAPFLKVSGSGGLDNFSLEAKADLESVFDEIGKFIPLEWGGQGALQLVATTAPGENGKYQVDTNLVIDDFSLFREGERLLPAHKLSMVGQAEAGFSWLGGEGVLDAQLQCNSWPGELFLRAAGVTKKSKTLSGRFNLNTELQLDRLASLGRSFGLLDASQQFDGVLGLHVSGKLIEKLLLIRGLIASIKDMETTLDGVTYQDPRIVFSIKGQGESSGSQAVDSLQIHDLVVVRSWEDLLLEGESETFVDFQQRKLFIDNLELDSRVFKLASTQLTVNDWFKPLENFKVRSNVKLELETANAILKDMGRVPEETGFTGELTANLHGQSLNADSQRVSVELQADGLDVLQGNNFVLQGEQADLKARLEGDLVRGDIHIPVVSIQSALLDLLASGVYKRIDHPSISLEGSVTPKLAQLGELLTKMSGHQVSMSGDRQNLFSLSCPLKGADTSILEQLVLSAGLSADSIGYMGVDAQQVQLPVVSKGGVLGATLQARLNDGRLSLSPQVDFTAPETVITVEDRSQILEKVQLEKPLVDGILGKVHPLFGVLTQPSGDVDMYLEHFSWPMTPDGGKRAEFTAVFDVSRLSLDSAGPLRQILDLVGVGEESLDLKNTEITCEAQHGRISCTPVRILVAGSEMTMKGSLGMDASLDYLLDIPVTEKLIGKEGYRVLAGSTIKVPIKGTLGKPLFNQNTVESAVRDLAQQAAVKTLEKQVDKILPDVFNKIFGQ